VEHHENPSSVPLQQLQDQAAAARSSDLPQVSCGLSAPVQAEKSPLPSLRQADRAPLTVAALNAAIEHFEKVRDAARQRDALLAQAAQVERRVRRPDMPRSVQL
jgi:hypothetical protein